MRVVTFKKYNVMCEYAADLFEEQIHLNPQIVLGLATGSTPIGFYDEIIRRNEAGSLTLKDATAYNLDEYCGISPENDQSYKYFMNEHLFDHVDIDKNRCFIPDAYSGNYEDACWRYDEAIERAGGIDMQLLGIGLNGHIGFNEPDDHFTKETHVVELTENTIQANSRFFDKIEDVPTKAVTMGMYSIMHAKKIVMMINGKKKYDIFRAATKGPIKPQCPASILQLHPDCYVLYSEE